MVAYYIPFANEISIKESVHYTVTFSQTEANMDLVRKTLYRVLPAAVDFGIFLQQPNRVFNQCELG